MGMQTKVEKILLFLPPSTRTDEVNYFFSPLCNTLLFDHISSFLTLWSSYLYVLWPEMNISNHLFFIYICQFSLWRNNVTATRQWLGSLVFCLLFAPPKGSPNDWRDDVDKLLYIARNQCPPLFNPPDTRDNIFLRRIGAMTYVACWNFTGLPNWAVDSILRLNSTHCQPTFHFCYLNMIRLSSVNSETPHEWLAERSFCRRHKNASKA